MRKRIMFTLLALLFWWNGAEAQSFDDYFIDKTLRVDYLFNGDASKQVISLDELVSLPGWAGRRHALDRLPLEGNGDITMVDKASGKVIYRRRHPIGAASFCAGSCCGGHRHGRRQMAG